MILSANDVKIRTTSELSTMCIVIGAFLTIACMASLFLVKSFLGAAVLLAVPVLYAIAILFVFRRSKNALMINVMNGEGIRNQHLGSILCDLSWTEIGDFGVVEVKRGIFKGKYIYMSRVFVQDGVRSNIIERYDPRVCIVLPYTKEVCKAATHFSCGKIDIR